MKGTFTCLIVCLFLASSFCHAQTSWTGASNVKWDNAANWTAGVPTATNDAIIGDANFTGAFQPTIDLGAVCKSLTIGSATLTVSKTLTVSGNLVINAGGAIVHGASSISLAGNWQNAGTYTATANSSQVIFNGITQSLNGPNVTTFRKLTINKGSVLTLTTNVTLSGGGSRLTVTGTLNPNESPTYQVTGTNLTLSNNCVLKVNAATFAGNYNFSGIVNMGATAVVNYSATAMNQTVSNALTYSTLRISGTGTKSLAGNLPMLRSTAAAQGNIYVESGTFDLLTFTANRGILSIGGTLAVFAGATLKIGGTNTLPANFSTRTFALTSTVEYNGTNQSPSAETYGNLSLSASAGTVTKTLPSTAFIVAGNFVSATGSGTALSFVANANISINGNTIINTGTTFSAGAFTHTMLGNYTNNGVLAGGTSTINFNGPAAVLSGTGTNNFNNITFGGSNITAAATTNINVAGNFSTVAPGTFTQSGAGTVSLTGTTKSITGTGINFANLSVTGSYTTTSSFAISENGTVGTGASFTATAGTVTMSGTTKTLSGAGNISFSSLTISGSITTTSSLSLSDALVVTGSFTATAGTATFTGNSTLNGVADLYSVRINGTSLKLLTSAVLGISNLFTITTGTLNVTSNIPNTVRYNGNMAQTVNSIT